MDLPALSLPLPTRGHGGGQAGTAAAPTIGLPEAYPLEQNGAETGYTDRKVYS
jgi:hypothetical protein